MRKMSHLAAWIAILMLLLISSGNAECTEDEKLMIGDYQIRCYEKRDVHDYVEIIKYTGNDSEIIIPEMIGDGIVRKICRNAFSNEKIKSIEIPSCVRILEWGFYPHGELWSGQVIPVEINVSPDNQFYETVDNVLYHKLPPKKTPEGENIVAPHPRRGGYHPPARSGLNHLLWYGEFAIGHPLP